MRSSQHGSWCALAPSRGSLESARSEAMECQGSVTVPRDGTCPAHPHPWGCWNSAPASGRRGSGIAAETTAQHGVTAKNQPGG